ncbi:cytidine deaminase [Desulfopila sp. IMCC35008]|uniref:cytidine deaminase n=1 Tax=Desulfopila sp. IMCC35008 TaxID=2653858 RepID=UPI0013D4DCA3|nr:cytidine deaminase [Desulfopila sp. IMCC35008]
MTPEQIDLLKAADKAALNAYAPYSKFRVGAAVLTDKGVFDGANIENACTNLGTCAERVALSHAHMHKCSSIIGIAISCIDATKDASGKAEINQIMPCGACRQWLNELAPNAWIVASGSKRVFSLSDLLPAPFTLSRE